MGTESIELRPRSGPQIIGSAQVRRTAAPWRTGRSVLIGVCGGMVAIVAVVVPPHGVFSLAVASFTGLSAYVAWSRGFAIGRLTATCGKCGAPFSVEELGSWSDDLWVRCVECKEPYRLGKPTENVTKT